MSREQAHADLIAALEGHTRAGRTVPCIRYPVRAWTSDDPAEQAPVAALCAACPALAACRTYITAHGERAGVWAGLTMKDRNATTGKPKEQP